MGLCACGPGAPGADTGTEGRSDTSSSSEPTSGTDSMGESESTRGADGESTSEGPESSSSGTPDDPLGGCWSSFDEGIPYGHAYVDTDSSDRSRYAGGFSDGDAAIEAMVLRLLGSDLPPLQTCPSGEYHVPVDDGVYVVAPEAHQGACSQRNCAARFPEALQEGSVKIVTLGDSVPVVGAGVTFPARVAELVSAVADVEENNLAASGTESSDWVPGSGHFEGARMQLEDADVVLVSVGGNDILTFASTVDLGDLGAALQGAQETVDQVVVNVLAIKDEIRSFNADVDVVFCLYPDYSQATMTPPWSDLGLLPPGVVTSLLVRARDGFSAEDDVVLVDLFGLTPSLPLPLDDYLDDPLHFNDLGHDLYAHEVFRALGGVIVGESPLATDPVTDNRVDFGYVIPSG